MNTLTDKLAAALRAIPADEYDMRVYEGDGFHYFCCGNSPHLGIEHAPGCWYIQAREALAEYDAQRAQPQAGITITLDDAEHATVLAALRAYQAAGYGDPYARPDDIHDIATSDGSLVSSLDDAGIDELCERLNGA